MKVITLYIVILSSISLFHQSTFAINKRLLLLATALFVNSDPEDQVVPDNDPSPPPPPLGDQEVPNS